MTNDILRDFTWHSAIGIDCALDDKKFVTRLRMSRNVMGMFEASGNDLLIHKTTRCLWKISDDKKYIEPVFGNDVLTEDDVREAMEDVK